MRLCVKGQRPRDVRTVRLNVGRARSCAPEIEFGPVVPVLDVVSRISAPAPKITIANICSPYTVTVLGKLFTPVVPLFTKQQNW